jgi:hypothetical protein
MSIEALQAALVILAPVAIVLALIVFDQIRSRRR